jgi:uncharacterized membrane protein YesL
LPRRGTQQVLQDELWGAYDRSIDLILVNVIWFLFSVPLVTAVPALGGLFYATNRMAHGSTGDWRVFWQGFRETFRLSWRWGLVNTVVLLFLGFNWWFYGQIEISGVLWIRGLILMLIAVWIQLQLFTFPLLLEQADQRFTVALRNSGVLLLRWPATALGATLEILIVTLPSIFIFPPAWIFISASLCAFLANRAVVTSVQKMKGS